MYIAQRKHQLLIIFKTLLHVYVQRLHDTLYFKGVLSKTLCSLLSGMGGGTNLALTFVEMGALPLSCVPEI